MSQSTVTGFPADQDLYEAIKNTSVGQMNQSQAGERGAAIQQIGENLKDIFDDAGDLSFTERNKGGTYRMDVNGHDVQYDFVMSASKQTHMFAVPQNTCLDSPVSMNLAILTAFTKTMIRERKL